MLFSFVFLIVEPVVMTGSTHGKDWRTPLHTLYNGDQVRKLLENLD